VSVDWQQEHDTAAIGFRSLSTEIAFLEQVEADLERRYEARPENQQISQMLRETRSLIMRFREAQAFWARAGILRESA
jgi:hypothetical protein